MIDKDELKRLISNFDKNIIWKRKPIVEWIIPPKHQLEIFGFLLILIGFWLQLIFYLA